MRLSQTLLLFALGRFYEGANSYLRDKHLCVVLSKTAFIELLYKTDIAGRDKKHLAYSVYKLLQKLENRKFLSYKNKTISFTNKGKREYNKIRKKIKPFLDIDELFKSAKVYTKSQTKFKLE